MAIDTSVTAAIAKYGRTMTLRRIAVNSATGAQTPTDVTLKGSPRGYKAVEIQGTIFQGDTQIRISDADIAAAAWPGPPRKDDQILLDGRTTTIISVESRYFGSVVLVHVCQVRG